MQPWFLGVLSSVVAGVVLAAVLGLWKMMRDFIREQRKENERNREFERSMQRAEIIRYFRIVVEQGNPITPEELSHLDACYEAYHANGGNGSGTLMYQRVLEHAKLVTSATAGDRREQ